MDEVLGACSVGTAGTLQVEQGPWLESLTPCPLTSPLPWLPGAVGFSPDGDWLQAEQDLPSVSVCET